MTRLTVRPSRLLAALVLALGATFATAGDAPPADVAAEVDRLLADVASDRYEVREAARKRLATIAKDARDALVARRDDPDPEVRRAVAQLLASIGETAAAPAPTRLDDLGLVTFAAEGSLSTVLAEWRTKVGGHVRLVRGARAEPLASAPVTVAAVRRPYFAVLDEILAGAGAVLLDGFDEAGRGHATRREPGVAAVPHAHWGPFRVEVESIGTARSLRPGHRPRSAVGLRLLWSPLVRVTAFRDPIVTKAVDGQGSGLRGTNRALVPDVTYGMALAGGHRAAGRSVTLEAAGDGVPDRIAELEVEWRVRLRHAPRVVSVDLTSRPLPRTVAAADHPGAGAVTLDAVQPEPDGFSRIELTVELPRGIHADEISFSLEQGDEEVRSLFDSSRRLGSSNGIVKLTLRTPNAALATPGQRLRVEWTTREDDVTAKFALKDVPLR